MRSNISIRVRNALKALFGREYAMCYTDTVQYEHWDGPAKGAGSTSFNSTKEARDFISAFRNKEHVLSFEYELYRKYPNGTKRLVDKSGVVSPHSLGAIIIGKEKPSQELPREGSTGL